MRKESKELLSGKLSIGKYGEIFSSNGLLIGILTIDNILDDKYEHLSEEEISEVLDNVIDYVTFKVDKKVDNDILNVENSDIFNFENDISEEIVNDTFRESEFTSEIKTSDGYKFLSIDLEFRYRNIIDFDKIGLIETEMIRFIIDSINNKS